MTYWYPFLTFQSALSLNLVEGPDDVEEYSLIIVTSQANDNIPHPATLHNTSYKSGNLGGGGIRACATCRPIIPTKLRLGIARNRNDLPENIDIIFVWPIPIRRNHTIDAKMVVIHQYATWRRST